MGDNIRVCRVYTVRGKYSVVAKLLQQAEGTLLDVGARDRRLAVRLDQQHLKYYSADLGEGCDYRIDLERGLPFPDSAFDYVVALDVLEHVEHIHQAFHELARITRRCLIIALPNLSALSRRWSFLWRGHLGTKKYDLYPEHQGDRHRWLTGYRQICAFISHHARSADCTVAQYDILTGYSRPHELISHLPLPAELRAYTILFEITKEIAPS